MAAPGGRGADRMVRTPVATPAVPPARQTDISSANTSRTELAPLQYFQFLPEVSRAIVVRKSSVWNDCSSAVLA